MQHLDLISFEDFVNFSLTKAHMRIGRSARDVGEVGEAGYWLAVAEFIGFLVGGFSTFVFVSTMPRCVVCSSYLRKLKSSHSGNLRNLRGVAAGCHAIEKGLEVALDIEELLYEATTLLNAASLINRIARQS
jgi:hypothetical protein